MRPIVLAALATGLTISGPAFAQQCAKDMHKQAFDFLRTPYAFPVGTRSVVSDLWNDRPTRVGDGETRITETVFRALEKLKSSNAVTIDTRHRNPEEREADVKGGIFRLVDVRPTAITSDPSYQLQGDYFTVSRFAYSGLRMDLATELKSPTDYYCLLQFTFDARFSPLIAPLVDAPEIAARRVRLLNKWDPYAHKWTFVALDHEPQRDSDFKKNAVPKAIQNLSLTR